MIVQFKNDAGILKEVKVGFSWTIFIFSGMPFLSRGMPLWGFVTIITSFFTFGLTGFIMAFIGNKMTAIHYLENGYKKAGEGWEIANVKWKMTGLPVSN